MIEKKTGKRFSTTKTTTISSKDDSIEVQTKFIKDLASTPSEQWRTFDNLMTGWEQRMTSLLKEKNLPHSPFLYWTVDDKKPKFKRAVNKKTTKESFLSRYIIDELGNKEDSPVGIASKIITTIGQLKKSKKNDALLLAFDFGELTKLFNVYNIESNQNKKNSKTSRRKHWADKLAKLLITSNANLTFNEYWNLIDSGEEYHHCFLNDNKTHVIYNKENGQQLKKSTFRTEYISKAKKSIKL